MDQSDANETSAPAKRSHHAPKVPAFTALKLVYGGNHASLWICFEDGDEVKLAECNDTGAPSPMMVPKAVLDLMVASGGKG